MEQCDLGAANVDRPAFLLLQNAIKKGVAPVALTLDASLFYSYSSGSSHTGFEALNTSKAYLYVDTTSTTLSLIVHHGIDFDTSGLSQPNSHVQMDITSLPIMATVAVADDTPSEFQKASPSSVHGNWMFNLNTDGVVFSGLPFPGNWSIQIAPKFLMGINAWHYVNGDKAETVLALNATVTLTAFDTPSSCRTNCTVPKCGDGVLDGGEVCDDGNTSSGDGCAANCASFE
jgi:cysteine-rich repeat protein